MANEMERSNPWISHTDISRRLFLKGTAAGAVGSIALGGSAVLAFADAQTINIVSDGDTNVTDWWTNTMKPMFEAANPGYSLNIVITRADGGNDVVAQRVVAAKKTNTDPKIDYFEEFDPRRVPGSAESGAYPAGNNPTLQLYASGTVSMVTAWSDMALQGMSQGVLPPTTKLVQLTDLGFCGGYAWSSIPSTTTKTDGVFKLANFMLTPEIQAKMIADFGAFPGIDWKHLPPELEAKYKDVIADSVPSFPDGGDWTAALNDGWYTNVATTLARG